MFLFGSAIFWIDIRLENDRQLDAINLDKDWLKVNLNNRHVAPSLIGSGSQAACEYDGNAAPAAARCVCVCVRVVVVLLVLLSIGEIN